MYISRVHKKTNTHALVPSRNRPQTTLGTKARGILDRADRGSDTIIVAFTVLEEILLLSEVGKIQIPLPCRDFVIALEKADNIDLAVNDTAVLLKAATFTSIRDRYDRMIIAQARVSGLPLITEDGVIQDSGLVRTVWE